MRRKLSFLVILFVFLWSPLFSQDALQDLQSSITATLEQAKQSNKNSQQEMSDLKAELSGLKTLSSEQTDTISRLETHLKNSEDSYNNISASLQTYVQKWTKSEEERKKVTKIAWKLGIIFGIMLLLKIARIALGIIPQTKTIANTIANTKIGKLIDIII